MAKLTLEVLPSTSLHLSLVTVQDIEGHKVEGFMGECRRKEQRGETKRPHPETK